MRVFLLRNAGCRTGLFVVFVQVVALEERRGGFQALCPSRLVVRGVDPCCRPARGVDAARFPTGDLDHRGARAVGQRRGIPFSGVRFFASQKFRFERTLAESRNTGTADLWCTNENQVATCDRAARVVAVQDFGFRFGLVSVAT